MAAPSSDPLPELDAQAALQAMVARLNELNVEKVALDDAAAGLPATDAEDLSENERRIVAIYEAARDELVGLTESEARRAYDEVSSEGAALLHDAEQVGVKAKVTIAALVAGESDALTEAARDAEDANRALTLFRLRHRIEGDARRAGPTEIIRAVALLAAALLAQTLIVHTWGDATIALAASVSAASLGLGLIAGFVGLRLIANDGAARVVGWLVVVASLGAVMSLCVALRLFDTSPSAWLSGAAIVLSATAIIGFSLAALLGRSAFADPRWGYDRLARAASLASGKFASVKTMLSARIDAARAPVEAELRELKEREKDLRSRGVQLGRRLRERRAAVEAISGQLAGHAGETLRFYRARNTEARPTPAPAHFNTSPFVPPRSPQREAVEALVDAPGSIDELIDRTSREVPVYGRTLIEAVVDRNLALQKMHFAAIGGFPSSGLSEIMRAAALEEEKPSRLVQVARGEAFEAVRAPSDLNGSGYAPKQFQRGHSSLVFVAVHKRDQLKAVRKRVRAQDKNAKDVAPPTPLGLADIGEVISVRLQLSGGCATEAQQNAPWRGEPLVFAFIVEPSADQSIGSLSVVASISIGEAMVGSIAFTRPLKGTAIRGMMRRTQDKTPRAVFDESRDEIEMQRVKSVFISYSHIDQERAAIVAGAYERAGVKIFQDRMSIKGGEQWEPRLLSEIERRDLFHLCWSNSANESDWVLKEARHALTVQKASREKRPHITIQMFEGPPWPPHPPDLDELHFDDFIRAATAAYSAADDRLRPSTIKPRRPD